MQKIYKCSKKVYIFFTGGLLFLLYVTTMAFKKGDILWSVICGLSALLVFAFLFILHKQTIIINDEGIEMNTIITNRLLRRHHAGWASITKIEEDHFWDILTFLYLFIYDEVKHREKLCLTLAMITDYKNHQDLVREILNRIPKATRIVGDVRKYCEYRPKITLRRMLLWFFLFAAIFQLVPAGIAYSRYEIMQWHSFILGAIFLIIAFVIFKKANKK